MVKCTFCGKEKEPHTGIHFIKNNGEVQYFCSRKCKMNSVKLRRDRRKIRWTEAFHVTREKARVREAAKKKNSK